MRRRGGVGRRLFRLRCCGAAVITGACLFVAGCAPTIYPYRVTTHDCNCTQYTVHDDGVTYSVRAEYWMDRGVATRIMLKLRNNSRDTLSTGAASVKISSENIQYQYNNKYVPLPGILILPKSTDSLSMSGRDVTGKDDWHLIAGERLTMTLRGITLGGTTLEPQEFMFVPENPKLGK